MTKTDGPILALCLAMAILFAYSLVTNVHADPTNVPSTVATTSNLSVTTTAALVFASSTCAARTISTTASPIMIGFTDAQGFVPTGIQGFLQPASTTVTYDAAQYGCKAVRVFSFVNGNITVQEAR